MSYLFVRRSAQQLVAALLSFSLSSSALASQPPTHEDAQPAEPSAPSASDSTTEPGHVPLQEEAGQAERGLTATQAPDLVRLTNGGLVRGTIAEHIPGEYVVIVLITGESRRFEAAEFSFAGPVDAAKTAAGPTTAEKVVDKPVELEGGDTLIHFEAAPDSPSAAIALSLRVNPRSSKAPANASDDSLVSTPICTAPCSAKIPGGRQSFGLSVVKRPVQPVPKIFNIHNNDTLVASYENRKWLRISGAIVFGTAATLGGLVLLRGVTLANEEKKAQDAAKDAGVDEFDPYEKDELTPGQKIEIAGGVILGLGAVIGIGLMVQKDRVRLEIKPKGL